MPDSAYYRTMAAKCRELAAGSLSDHAKAGLLKTAREYEEEADRLEASIDPEPPAAQ